MEQQMIFREMLGELKAMAQSKGGRLSRQETEAFFEKTALTGEQIDLICEYLLTQGIILDGYKRNRAAASRIGAQEEQPSETAAKDAVSETEGKKREDSAGPAQEEELPGILELYMQELAGLSDTPDREAREELRLFEALIDGDESARDELVREYLPMIARMAGEYEEENIETEDLLQEGNIALLTTLAGMERQDSLAAYRALLLNGINEAMSAAISGYGEEKSIGTAAAAKVNLIQDAIRELSEDSETTVTIGELSVYLDMPAEEIRSIIRLAGDEISIS